MANVLHRVWTRSRRHLRFRLRTLMLLVTIFCLWFGLCARRAREQAAAVAVFREFGGEPSYEFQVRAKRFHPREQPPLPAWLVSVFGIDFFYDVVWIQFHPNERRLKKHGLSAYAPADMLRPLESLPKLRVVFMTGMATDEGLRHVGTLADLETLEINHAPRVTDAGIRHLEKLSKLRYLGLTNSQLSDASLKVLRNLESLESLDLDGGILSDDGLAYLAGNATLRDLSVGRSRAAVTDRGMRHIGELVRLEDLDVTDAQITSSGLKYIRKFTNLRALRLAGNIGITDEGMQCLTDFGKLESVTLGGTSITIAGFKQIRRFKQLQFLDLSRNLQVTDAWMPYVANYDKLEQINLAHTAVTSAGLQHLKKLKKLAMLDIVGTKVKASSLQPLLPGCMITDDEIAELLQPKDESGPSSSAGAITGS